MKNVKSDLPLVSIIMSSYNHEAFIVECLTSIVEQDYESIEICFRDNCSGDSTFEKANEFLLSYSDRFVACKIVQNDRNLGVTSSLNKALADAVGEYVLTVFTDDYLEPDCISTFVDNMKQCHVFDGLFTCNSFRVSTQSKLLGSRRAPIPGGLVSKDIFFDSLFALGANELQVVPFFCSAQTLRTLGGFDERFLSLEWDLYIRFNALCGVYHIDTPLYNFRVTPGSAGTRVFEYADGLLEAVDDLRDLLGSSYGRYRFLTMKRVLRVFFGNYFFVDGGRRTFRYIKQLGTAEKIDLLGFSLIDFVKYMFKRNLSYNISQFITFRLKKITEKPS